MKKILLFTAALLCATSMWADLTYEKWVPYGSETMACGKNEYDSVHYSQFIETTTTWPNANVAVYHNDSTFGDTITGSSPAQGKMGVFSLYYAYFHTPSYARTRYSWKFKIGSHNQKHHSTVCLYYSQDEHPAGISLKDKKVDFSDNHATLAGEKYLLVPPFVKDNQEETAGWNYSEVYTKEFTFDFRYEVHADPTYCVLMLTHVIESGDNGKSGLQEISCIKTIEDITLVKTDYYKIVTFNANGGTGTMDKDTIENSGKLSANIFTRDGYYFLGWATSQNGAVEYFDEATITATEDSKGPVTLYAQWQEADYAPIIFQYNYDCQRNPPYPKKNVDALVSNFNYPLIGNNNYVGPWKLEYLEMYNADHATMYYPSEPTIRDRARTMLVSYFGEKNVPSSDNTDEFNVYAHEHLPVYRLSQWDETTSAFKVAAYGYAAVRANKDNAKGKVILFEQAGIARGCFLTDTLRNNTDNLSITFDADLTDSILTFRPASITAAPTAKLGMVYDGSEKTLINAGTAVGGTMHYSLDNADWSADLPKATNAGTYMVYYKVVGDATHADYTPADNTVTAKIDKATATYTTRPAAIPYLKYTGKEQALVTAGKAAEGVQISYSRGNSEVWQANPSTAYQAGNYYVYYKIVGDDNHYGVGPDTLIATIHPTGSPVPADENYDASKISVLAVQEGVNTPQDQHSDKLFDGKRDTKWCSLKNSTDAYSKRPKDMVVWRTEGFVKMVSYTLTTGDDTQTHPNRNWSSWTLYGGKFESDNDAKSALLTEDGWTIIDNQIQDTVLKAFNDSSFQFACNNPGWYKYYRLVIHDIRRDSTPQDNIQQMAELTMGVTTFTPPTYVTRPSAKAYLKHSGDAQPLINAGSATNGATVVYKLGNGEWSADVPQATDSGNYYVYYKIKASASGLYPESEPDTLITTIYGNKTVPVHDNYPYGGISVLAKQEGFNTKDSQIANMLFNGDANLDDRLNKWCSETTDITKYEDRPKDIVVWKTADTIKMISYELRIGNDAETYHNRNWYSWTIYGGKFDSDDAARAALTTEEGWKIIDNQINDTVLKEKNLERYNFVCNNPGTYKYYRLVIHALHVTDSSSTANQSVQQMQELTMGIEHVVPVYQTRPSAKAYLQYTGEKQTLIEPGIPTQAGTILYQLKGDQNWSTELPQATDSGNYYVYYKIDGSEIAPDTLIATIYGNWTVPEHDDYSYSNISVLAKQEGYSTHDSEKANHLFDNNISSKWCSVSGGIEKYENRPKDIVVWKTASAIKMVSYQLQTAYDTGTYPNRNWYSWTIYGGLFGSDDAARAAMLNEGAWKIIDNQIKDTVLKEVNDAQYNFACNNPDTYQYYRLVIHALHVTDSAKNQGVQQMAELTMGIEKATPPTGIDETIVNRKSSNRKFIKDGQLFILRDGKKYNAQGVLVESRK